jgi:hypothetical protein
MLKIVSKVGLITTPAFIATHLIQKNKDNIREYCPCVKYKKNKNSLVSPKHNYNEFNKLNK